MDGDACVCVGVRGRSCSPLRNRPHLPSLPQHPLERELGGVDDGVVHDGHQQHRRQHLVQGVWHVDQVREGQAQHPQEAPARGEVRCGEVGVRVRVGVDQVREGQAQHAQEAPASGEVAGGGVDGLLGVLGPAHTPGRRASGCLWSCWSDHTCHSRDGCAGL